MAFALLLRPVPTHAWAYRGHRVIADIAMDHLTPAAREGLRELLGEKDLASIATWADDIKNGRPETKPWHYVDIPSSANGYQATRDCPENTCVVAKIEQFEAVLSDRSEPLQARQEALKYLVHFIGDVHQPFHALGDAAGGNNIPVLVFGSNRCGKRTCNLHGFWDFDIVMHNGLREHRYATRLEEMISAQLLDAGASTPEEWANESFALAKQAVLQPGADVDEAYYSRESPVVDRQLALAGLRLARVLNAELGTPSSRRAP